MNIIKTEKSINIKLTLLENLYQLENACLDLRRSIVNLPAASVKKRLLFYIDSLIEIDIYFYLEGIKNKIEVMRFIAHRVSIKSSIEHRLISLKDAFLIIYEKMNYVI
ncbi:MAG: hypothetical protein K0R24_2022 [Gammaproteobacteria bacterium]|jgi:hypothetical protein|nr:hypothetical protein [Gammaproteobacteria bacterium]